MQIWYRIVIETAVGLGIALLLRRYVCLFVWIKGNSMKDTLNDKEVVSLKRYSSRRKPARGDIVVCRFKEKRELCIKRIIAMPGESIRMENDIVYINEIPLTENYPKRRCIRILEPVQLGDDEYFLMGDNRPISKDSRKMGPVNSKDILGRGICVLFPWKKHRMIY